MDSVLSEIQGPVGILTLNRPDKLNAWNAPMRARLVEALDELEANEAVRATGPSSGSANGSGSTTESARSPSRSLPP
jgi:hypothetical protein